MKILFVSSYYLPYVSGLTVHAQRLAEGLVQKGHSVSLVTNIHAKDVASSEINKGVTIKRARPWFRLSRGFVSPGLFPLFLKELKEVEVVVFHLPLPEAFPFSLMAKLSGKRIYLIYHANLNLPSWSFSGRIIENLVFFNHCLAGILANKIIAYSQDYANYAKFLKTFTKKVTTIFPPVFMRTPNKKLAKQWKEKLKLTDCKIVGFAGRFAEEKGGDILIEAIPEIIKKIPNVKIVFAGEENLAYEDFYRRKRNLIKKHEDRILFIGLIPPEKMSEFYAMCDVLALPSRNECFGLVQVEAMLCGVPVVAFNIPGGRVPVLKTGMGFLVKNMTPKSFSEGLIKAVIKRKSFVKKKSEVNKIFNLGQTIKKYEKIFSI